MTTTSTNERRSLHCDLLELHAREKTLMPSEWRVYSYKCMPLGSVETHYYELAGAVVPNITKGKRIGKPNFARKEKATVRTVIITPKEHTEWMSAWERKTGMCSECTGTGEVFKEWSVKNGLAYRPCKKCNGTGTSSNLDSGGCNPQVV